MSQAITIARRVRVVDTHWCVQCALHEIRLLRGQVVFRMQSIDSLRVGVVRDSLSAPAEKTRSKPSELTGADIQAIMKAHNDLRAKYNVAPLTWDNSLANMAKTWADQCYWGHWRDPQTKQALGASYRPPPGVAGENLSVWTDTGATGLSGQYGTQLWVNEEPVFNCETGQCIGAGMCGHYTQMVWEGTKRIGCALRTCERGVDPRSWDSNVKGIPGVKYFVCQYSPPGNISGRPPFPADRCAGAGQRGAAQEQRKITSQQPIERQQRTLRQPPPREPPVVVEDTTVRQEPENDERVVAEDIQQRRQSGVGDQTHLLYPSRGGGGRGAPTQRPAPSRPFVTPVNATGLQRPGTAPTTTPAGTPQLTILPPQGVNPPVQPRDDEPMSLVQIDPGQRATPGRPVELVQLQPTNGGSPNNGNEQEGEIESTANEATGENGDSDANEGDEALQPSSTIVNEQVQAEQPEVVRSVSKNDTTELPPQMAVVATEPDDAAMDIGSVTGIALLGAVILGAVLGVIVWYAALKRPHDAKANDTTEKAWTVLHRNPN